MRLQATKASRIVPYLRSAAFSQKSLNFPARSTCVNFQLTKKSKSFFKTFPRERKIIEANCVGAKVHLSSSVQHPEFNLDNHTHKERPAVHSSHKHTTLESARDWEVFVR